MPVSSLWRQRHCGRGVEVKRACALLGFTAQVGHRAVHIMRETDMRTTAPPTIGAAENQHQTPARVVCGAAAAAALVPFALANLSGDTGAEITAGLVEDASMLAVATIVAMLVAAALFLAAVRLASAVGGRAGRVVAASGAAVALMFAAYYSTFGAAAVVATQMLESPGAGLGESASLLLNLTEITRYAPGFALVVAAAVARHALPKGVAMTAAVLAFLSLVPFTSWVAALLIPVWLLVSATVVTDSRD